MRYEPHRLLDSLIEDVRDIEDQVQVLKKNLQLVSESMRRNECVISINDDEDENHPWRDLV